jgi:hypothetical protein
MTIVRAHHASRAEPTPNALTRQMEPPQGKEVAARAQYRSWVRHSSAGGRTLGLSSSANANVTAPVLDTGVSMDLGVIDPSSTSASSPLARRRRSSGFRWVCTASPPALWYVSTARSRNSITVSALLADRVALASGSLEMKVRTARVNCRVTANKNHGEERLQRLTEQFGQRCSPRCEGRRFWH